MGFIKQNYRAIRTVDMSGGFVADPDWVANFDAAGARAAGSVTVTPLTSGVLELVYGFANLAGDHIAPDPPTRVDLHVIVLGSGSEAGPGNKAIYELEPCLNLDSTEICQLVRPVVGPSYVAIRVTGLISPPATAAFISVSARVG